MSELARAVGEQMTWQRAVLGLLIFLVSFFGSIGLTALVVIRLPPEFFLGDEVRAFWTDRPAWQRLAGRVAKNLLGLLLVVAGIVMSLPGVPGQGVLTILIGVMLLDFPGKRRLERKIACSPRVFGALNKLRARFGKPPLIHPDAHAAAEAHASST